MQKRQILIADDDTDLVALLSLRSQKCGLKVVTASDAVSALKSIQEVRPDVVILDVNMPGGNGLTVRDVMMQNEQLQSIPVIVLTGASDEETIRRCHNTCSYYVAKCPDVWTRIKPILDDIFEHEAPHDKLPVDNNIKAAPESAYEDSDQKVLFDWLFDLMDGAAPAVAGVVGLDVAGPADGDEATEIISEVSTPDPSEAPWVLCIDDDAELTLGIEMRLREHGVEVLRTFTGMDGYRSAFIGNPRVIILDYEMPQGNGDYVLRRIKETAATRDIPVIVLTGRKGHDVERKMYNLGADAFLTKPCSWETLWPILQQHIEMVKV